MRYSLKTKLLPSLIPIIFSCIMLSAGIPLLVLQVKSDIVFYFCLSISMLGSIFLFGFFKDAIQQTEPISVSDIQVTIKKIKFPFSHTVFNISYSDIGKFTYLPSEMIYGDRKSVECFELVFNNGQPKIVLPIGSQHSGSRENIELFVNSKMSQCN